MAGGRLDAAEGAALGAEWNGRLLFQGGGGLNGSVAPPLGRTGRSGAALARGFAVVTTDTGHRGAVFDASFMADQQANLDFAYQAVGRVAVFAKQILAQHYGRSRPLCPYPSHAQYKGTGDVEDAASFECRPLRAPGSPPPR